MNTAAATEYGPCPREEYVFDEQEIILVAAGGLGATTVTGSWEITARGHNEIYTGTVEVEVAELFDLTNVMREYLGLHSSGQAGESDEEGLTACGAHEG